MLSVPSSSFVAVLLGSILFLEGGTAVAALQNPNNEPCCSSRGKSKQGQKILRSIPYFFNLPPVESKTSVASDIFGEQKERLEMPTSIVYRYFEKLEVEEEEETKYISLDYGAFAKEHPFMNNMLIATIKTGFADFLVQTVISGTPIDSVDWERSLLFCLFGFFYLGAFQYLYQVNVFRRLFDVDKFTSQSWSEKLKDIPGLKALGAQTVLDLAVSMAIYFPVFYTFKASLFSGSMDPSVWLDIGMSDYGTNFVTDEESCIMCWLPANLICFSVPLFLRLPARHAVSFLWTAYFSFMRG